MTSRLRIPDWVLLLAFCLFFFLWRLSSFGLIGADEPRYAQIAREMLSRHDWITPTLGGSPWLEKPPLYYWQAMIAYAVFGVSDWAARLPSVFDASVMVFAVYFFLRRFLAETARDGALILASSAGIVGYARAASTDMPLTAMFTIAMLAWFASLESGSRWQLASFYVFVGLAMLAKGPVAPLLAVMMIALFAVACRDRKILWRSFSPAGILLFCAVSLPWYLAAQLRNPQFFRIFILQHNLARFGTNVFHHPEPFWYYLPVTLVGWVPWTVLVIAALVLAVQRFRKTDDRLSLFLLIWIAVVILLFSISQSKLPGYVLPAIPPGVVLLSKYLRAKVNQKPSLTLVLSHAAVMGALIFAALLCRYVVLQHRFEWNSSMLMPLLMALVVAIAAAFTLVKFGFSGVRVATIVPTVVALALALRFGAPALDETYSARSVSEALSRVAPRALPLAVVLVPRETEYGLQFYRNQPIPRYELRQVPSTEHLIVAAQGFRNAFSKNVPGRHIVYLGNFPSQKLEFFYVGP